MCKHIISNFLDCRYGMKSVTFVFMDVVYVVTFVRMKIFGHDFKFGSNPNKLCMSLAWK